MKIKKRELQYFIMGFAAILVYAWPYYYSVLFPGFNGLIRSIFRYISYLITIFCAIVNQKKLLKIIKKSKTFVALIMCIMVVLLVSTVRNGGKLGELFNAYYQCMFFIVLIGAALADKSRYLLKGISCHYNYLIIMTFLTKLVPFMGISGVYNFATTKNVYLRFVFLGILIDAYLDTKEHKELQVRTYIYFALISLTTLFVRSSTGFFVSFIALVLLILKRVVFKNKMPVIKAKIFLLISLGIAALTVFFRQFTFYANAIQYLFGKDITFTGRSTLWEQAVTRIHQSPVWGVGHISSTSSIQLFGNEQWNSVSCHNIYLDIMVETGLIGLVIFLLFLYLLSDALDQHDVENMRQDFSILFLCYYISYDFEVFFNGGQYIYNFPVLFFMIFCFADERKIRNVFSLKRLKKKKTIH